MNLAGLRPFGPGCSREYIGRGDVPCPFQPALR